MSRMTQSSTKQACKFTKSKSLVQTRVPFHFKKTGMASHCEKLKAPNLEPKHFHNDALTACLAQLGSHQKPKRKAKKSSKNPDCEENHAERERGNRLHTGPFAYKLLRARSYYFPSELSLLLLALACDSQWRRVKIKDQSGRSKLAKPGKARIPLLTVTL